MIHAYTWPTPNGEKVHFVLEESGLPFVVRPVALGAGEQHDPWFRALSPNAKIPALVDTCGPGGRTVRLFESGAILTYVAHKCGRLLPERKSDPIGHFDTLKWLMFASSSVAEAIVDYYHYLCYAPDRIPYALERGRSQVIRLYDVIDQRLRQSEYLATDQMTIADIAAYSFLRYSDRLSLPLAPYPGIERWLMSIVSRPAISRATAILAEQRPPHRDLGRARVAVRAPAQPTTLACRSETGGPR